MRNYLFGIFLFSQTIPVIAQDGTNTLNTQIKKVTVFTTGAQITRNGSGTLKAGKSMILLKGLSPYLDKQSIQVKGTGRFTILSVSHQISFLNEQSRREETSRLEQQRDQLRLRIENERSQWQIYKNEEQILLKNQSVGGTNTGLKAADLKEAVDFHRTRMTEVYQKQLELDRQVRRTDSAIQKLNQELQALQNNTDKRTSEIQIAVEALASVTADFEVSYYVRNSGWFPSYDVHVEDVSSPVRMAFKANVFQQSGEDWKDVKLFISNGNPTENGNAPKLYPWYLQVRSMPPPVANALTGRIAGVQLSGQTISGQVIDMKDGSPVPFATIRVSGTTTGTQTDANGQYNLRLPSGASQLEVSSVGYELTRVAASGAALIRLNPATQNLSEVVVTGYGAIRDDDERPYTAKLKIRGAASIQADQLETVHTYQPTTFSYEIKTPYSIPADGKSYRVDLKEESISAEFQYTAVPKLDPSAYLTARIANWQEYNMLEGEMSLFFEGAFLGKSVLDLSTAEDTLQLSLGKDKSISIERKKLKEYSSRQFLSSNKTDSRAYELVIRNNKPQPVNLVVYDQFPISQNKEITIDEQESSGAQVEDDTRILVWRYQLPAREEKKHLVKFSVKYPRQLQLQLD